MFEITKRKYISNLKVPIAVIHYLIKTLSMTQIILKYRQNAA